MDWKSIWTPFVRARKIDLLRAFFRRLWFRIRYGSRFSAPVMQHQWGRNLKICIEDNGRVRLGRLEWIRDNVRMDCTKDAELLLGDRVFLNNGTYISARRKITIGSNSSFGPNVMVFDHDHDYKNNLRGFVEGEIVIGSDVWVGANAVILRGSRIGDHAVIGAGCVIKGEVPPYSVVTSKENLVIRKYEPLWKTEELPSDTERDQE